jgi:AcrR family transcriptional regulator
MAPAKTAEAERTKLSRAAVVDRALWLADAEGVEALTIRRLAQELGVTPMALYWHFRNKEELIGRGLAEATPRPARVPDRRTPRPRLGAFCAARR